MDNRNIINTTNKYLIYNMIRVVNPLILINNVINLKFIFEAKINLNENYV